MSTSPTTAKPKVADEIRIISHTTLFYWWPVWAFGFLFAIWTYFEGSRLLIVPKKADMVVSANGEDYTIHFPKADESKGEKKQGFMEVDEAENGKVQPKIKCTQNAWMGPLYLMIIILVIFITNVPLRGLWSIVSIIFLVMVALVLALLGWWDDIFLRLGALHVYINMGGYLFLSTVLFIIWFVAVNFFDKRTYIIFTKGQVRVCEEIGGREKTYDTIGMTIEKHRDDLFRHWVLGLGSGDLTVRTSGADHHQISMPNVLRIGNRLPKIEALLREARNPGPGTL